VHDVDDLAHVLVRLWHLLRERVTPGGTRDDALGRELTSDIASACRLDGRGAAHESARAMARRAKRLGERLVSSAEHVRVAAHVARHEHWLAGKRARRALPMHDETTAAAVDVVLFELGDVVRDVVHGRDAEPRRGSLEDALEHFAGPVR